MGIFLGVIGLLIVSLLRESTMGYLVFVMAPYLVFTLASIAIFVEVKEEKIPRWLLIFWCGKKNLTLKEKEIK